MSRVYVEHTPNLWLLSYILDGELFAFYHELMKQKKCNFPHETSGFLDNCLQVVQSCDHVHYHRQLHIYDDESAA